MKKIKMIILYLFSLLISLNLLLFINYYHSKNQMENTFIIAKKLNNKKSNILITESKNYQIIWSQLYNNCEILFSDNIFIKNCTKN